MKIQLRLAALKRILDFRSQVRQMTGVYDPPVSIWGSYRSILGGVIAPIKGAKKL